MTIDLGQFSGTLYFYGTKASYTDWHFKLKGRYSNEYLSFADDSDELALVDDVNKTNWYSLGWLNSYNSQKDVAGYYILELYGDDNLVLSTLVKVINATGIGSDTAFVSTNNENNEQVIYYR